MRQFSVPTKSEVNQENQATFAELEKGLGFVPNLYAYYAKHETALNDYLQFQGRKNTLSKKEQEVINLVVSQYNNCTYCLAAHTVLGGLNGFTENQIIEIRKGSAGFDSKLNSLITFVSHVLENRGKLSEESKESFFDAGYSEANLIDVVININTKAISNYIHNITDFAIDFPIAPSLEEVIV